MIEIFERYRQAQLRDLQRREVNDNPIPREAESRRTVRQMMKRIEIIMSNENALKKVTSPEIDGFEGYEDRIEGDDRSEGGWHHPRQPSPVQQ